MNESALPENLHRELGRVTAEFAALEDELHYVIWTLLSWDQTLGQLVTAELSFKQLVALASSLFGYRSRNREDVNALESVLTRVAAVEARRNTLVHSRWLDANGPTAAIRWKRTARRKQGLRHQFEETPIADIQALADDIAAVKNDLYAFVTRVAKAYTPEYSRGSDAPAV